jgi:twitching motility two-component system response regulator PilH
MVRKHILVVDDNEFFLEQEVSCLNRARFDISKAVSGKEALVKVRALKPDLILMDMVMPDIFGTDVCKILKEDPLTAAIPVIIVSSAGREDSKVKTAAAGCDGIIFKPIRKDQLIAMVEGLLEIQGRNWERVEVSLPCMVTALLDGEHGEGTIHTLGGGGAFIECSFKLVPGDMCGLQFTFPGSDRKIMVWSAVAVWTGRLIENGPEGFGLRFLTIDKDDQEEIDNYLVQCQSKAE